MDEEKIDDEKINLRMKALEKSVREGKDGEKNQHLSEISQKLTNEGTQQSEWKRYTEQIKLQLERILKFKNVVMVNDYLLLFKDKLKQKKDLNKLSELLKNYIKDIVDQNVNSPHLINIVFCSQTKVFVQDLK